MMVFIGKLKLNYHSKPSQAKPSQSALQPAVHILFMPPISFPIFIYWFDIASIAMNVLFLQKSSDAIATSCVDRCGCWIKRKCVADCEFTTHIFSPVKYLFSSSVAPSRRRRRCCCRHWLTHSIYSWAFCLFVTFLSILRHERFDVKFSLKKSLTHTYPTITTWVIFCSNLKTRKSGKMIAFQVSALSFGGEMHTLLDSMEEQPAEASKVSTTIRNVSSQGSKRSMTTMAHTAKLVLRNKKIKHHFQSV